MRFYQTTTWHDTQMFSVLRREVVDPAPEGILLEKLGGLCGPLPKTLTLFMTKICDIPNPIYELFQSGVVIVL